MADPRARLEELRQRKRYAELKQKQAGGESVPRETSRDIPRCVSRGTVQELTPGNQDRCFTTRKSRRRLPPGAPLGRIPSVRPC